jgi:hypothetical protein
MKKYDSNLSKYEIVEYLTAPTEERSVEPLFFWADNKKRYPILSILARDLLCIPASSFPVECIFSQADELIIAKRKATNRVNQNTYVSKFVANCRFFQLIFLNFK